VKQESLAKQGKRWEGGEAEAYINTIREQFARQGHPYYATARLWDDGIIDPVQTRDYLGLGITAALNAPINKTDYGIFRM